MGGEKMRLTQKDYFEAYVKFGYIIDILYHSSGALYLKDLCKYTNKSYSHLYSILESKYVR